MRAYAFTSALLIVTAALAVGTHAARMPLSLRGGMMVRGVPSLFFDSGSILAAASELAEQQHRTTDEDANIDENALAMEVAAHVQFYGAASGAGLLADYEHDHDGVPSAAFGAAAFEPTEQFPAPLLIELEGADEVISVEQQQGPLAEAAAAAQRAKQHFRHQRAEPMHSTAAEDGDARPLHS